MKKTKFTIFMISILLLGGCSSINQNQRDGIEKVNSSNSNTESSNLSGVKEDLDFAKRNTQVETNGDIVLPEITDPKSEIGVFLNNSKNKLNAITAERDQKLQELGKVKALNIYDDPYSVKDIALIEELIKKLRLSQDIYNDDDEQYRQYISEFYADAEVATKTDLPLTFKEEIDAFKTQNEKYVKLSLGLNELRNKWVDSYIKYYEFLINNNADIDIARNEVTFNSTELTQEHESLLNKFYEDEDAYMAARKEYQQTGQSLVQPSV